MKHIVVFCLFFKLGYGDLIGEYTHFAKENGFSDAVAVVAFNRPDYLKQLLESIEKNPESKTLPFFFFLDGGPYSTQEENEYLIEHSSIEHKQIIKRPLNYGCPKNHIDSKRLLFDVCGFDRIVVLEEDLKITKNYFAQLFKLDLWAQTHYSNIGTVQLWSYCFLNPFKKNRLLPYVQEVSPNYSLVTYCMRRSVWEKISPFLYEYEKFIDPLLGDEIYHKLRSKPFNGPTFVEYQSWIKNKIGQLNRTALCKEFPKDRIFWPSSRLLKEWMLDDDYHMNQDQITTLSLWLMGYTRLQTIVNRAIHIGEFGISGTFDTQKHSLIEFPEDCEVLRFKPIKIL